MSGLLEIWFDGARPLTPPLYPNPAQAEPVEARQRPCGLPVTLPVARKLSDQIPVPRDQGLLLRAAPPFELAFGGKGLVAGQEAI